ncbi:MAG TPA: HAD family phosphatase [Micromonosporaceae bacterium]
MTDAVVFDLDGVILDSEPVWEQVRRGYVAGHGGRWLPDTQRRLMGMNTAEWAGYLSHDLGVQRTPEQVAADVVEQMVERYTQRVPLIPGADRRVRDLAAVWRLGLASSSPPRLIEAALVATGLADAFAVHLSADQVARGKPAPDVYQAVASRLGLSTANCVAVEDSSNGVRAAAAAGMSVVALPHPRYPLDPDARDRTAVVLPDIAELTPQVVRSLPANHPVRFRRPPRGPAG